jgi:hypothetical protein
MADAHGRASLRQSLTDALATADLRRSQLNWTAAAVGSWIFFIVLAVYAYDQGGATAVGVAALARMLPAGLAAPLAGVVVDRRWWESRWCSSPRYPGCRSRWRCS